MHVGLLVRSHRELRDVSRHHIVGHLDHNHPAAGASVLSFDKLEALHVPDEIGIRKSLGRNFRVAAEKVFLTVIPVGERIIAFEDEVDVVKEI